MIMITETITAKPGQNDIIIEKSQYLIEYARLKPGCVSYHVYTSTENKDFLLMMDHWKNTEVLEEKVNKCRLMRIRHFTSLRLARR